MTISSLRRASLSTAALIAVSSSALFAQGSSRQLFEWTGDVDREVQIVMRDRDLRTRDYGNNSGIRRQHREQVIGALPRTDGRVIARLADGRGDADVIQQPSAQNNYTTIVRIRDGRGGSDRYRLDAYWRPANDGQWDRNDRNDRNGRNDRNNTNDDWYDRGRGVDTRDRAGERPNRGPYGGNGRSVLHWSGDVDDALEIRIQGDRVEYRTLSGARPRGVEAGSIDIPRQNVTLRVDENQGRGDVRIIQQPAAWNGYTTVLRVEDPQAGYGRYNFDLVM